MILVNNFFSSVSVFWAGESFEDTLVLTVRKQHYHPDVGH